MGVWSSTFKRQARELSGKTWTERHEHAYFENLIFYGSNHPDQCYWEADVPYAGSCDGRIVVMMTGRSEEPTEREQAFCEYTLSDPDALFRLCAEAFSQVFEKWTGGAIPANWREAFELDGFEIPKDGDPRNKWEICYYVEATHHYFIAVLSKGRVVDVRVEG
ncbi:MAG: hypothetical protein AAF671_11615 [Pseudomonadota bacterium]